MSGGTKQIIFRYNTGEHPNLDTWLGNQSNRTQSIIHALERVIIETGVDRDIVKDTLSKSLKAVDTEPLEPAGDDE